ncbi:MAG: FCD domain-containing protein [Chloroflexota bacterium]
MDSEFLTYLVEQGIGPGERLPALADLGAEMGVSVGALREQLEVARSLGFVSVRPRLGIRREPFDFAPAVRASVLFALATGEASFAQFSQLRQAIERGFWHEAVILLTAEDKAELQAIVGQAWGKLKGDPIHIPNGEHRRLHLGIFRRLENPFVKGLLDAYWGAYEASELTRFAEYSYWLKVWTYHERIVEALCQNDLEGGRQLLIEHFALLPAAPTLEER